MNIFSRNDEQLRLGALAWARFKGYCGGSDEPVGPVLGRPGGILGAPCGVLGLFVGERANEATRPTGILRTRGSRLVVSRGVFSRLVMA